MSARIFQPNGIVADANVLIDYLESDERILSLINHHIAPVKITTPTLEKVDQLTKERAEELGLEIAEPSLKQLEEAASTRYRKVSFDDMVCYIMARENGWYCMTNDEQLRILCEGDKVNFVWGLEAMVLLVEQDVLKPKKALAVANRIHEVNPHYINSKIVDDFRKKIGLK